VKNNHKGHSSWKNYLKYHKDRHSEKLENAVLQHPDEKDGVYDFMKKNITRNMWVSDKKKLDKVGESIGKGYTIKVNETKCYTSFDSYISRT
jgi:hypothetical protein